MRAGGNSDRAPSRANMSMRRRKYCMDIDTTPQRDGSGTMSLVGVVARSCTSGILATKPVYRSMKRVSHETRVQRHTNSVRSLLNSLFSRHGDLRWTRRNIDSAYSNGR